MLIINVLSGLVKTLYQLRHGCIGWGCSRGRSWRHKSLLFSDGNIVPFFVQISYRKKYRRSSTVRRGVSDKEEKLMQTQHLAAVMIQSLVRMILVRKR